MIVIAGTVILFACGAYYLIAKMQGPVLLGPGDVNTARTIVRWAYLEQGKPETLNRILLRLGSNRFATLEAPELLLLAPLIDRTIAGEGATSGLAAEYEPSFRDDVVRLKARLQARGKWPLAT